MPERLLSQLAHVEIVTPTPDESLRFSIDVLGPQHSGTVGGSAYLRGWGDFFHHTLQVTEGDAPGLGHIAWRAEGPEQLQTAVAADRGDRPGEGWYEDVVGHGPAYRYRSPGGHLHEIFWEVERYEAPPELVSPFPNRPQRYVPARRRAALHRPRHGRDRRPGRRRGLAARDARPPLHGVHGDPRPAGLRRLRDDDRLRAKPRPRARVGPSGVPGRVNHVAYFVDSREELLRVADVLLNADVAIEFGPGKHGMGEQDYLYFREPGGMRVEINAGGYRNYEPDWQTVRYEPHQGSNVFYRNLGLPHSMFESLPAGRDGARDGGRDEGRDRALQLTARRARPRRRGRDRRPLDHDRAAAGRRRGRRRRAQPEVGRLRRRDHPARQRDPRARPARPRRAGDRAGLRDPGVALPRRRGKRARRTCPRRRSSATGTRG